MVLLGALWASPVSAQDRQRPPPDKAAAVALAEQGWAHYEAGRYAEALQAFREAESKIHAPPFLRMVARCYAKLGRLRDARGVYQLVVDERLAPGAPSAFREAQASAKKELDELELRIPTVEISIAGAASGGFALTLDGLPIAPSTPVPRDPGDHVLELRVPGRRPFTRTVRLTEGARERVQIDEATINALPIAEQPGGDVDRRKLRAATEGQLSADRADGSTRWLGLDRRTAVLVGGGTLAGIGITTGIICTMLANGQSDNVETLKEELISRQNGPVECSGADASLCAELKDAAFSRARFSNAAFWSFVAGGTVGVGTLIYGVVTRSTAEPPSSLQVAPLFATGATGVSLSGRF